MPSRHRFLELRLEDFVQSFGTIVDEIPDDCEELIAKTDFRYRKCTGEERDRIVLDILKRIQFGDLKVSGKEGRLGKRMVHQAESCLALVGEDLSCFCEAGTPA